MIIATEDKDQRRCFTYEERLAALKRSGKRCACCGKKLTTKTMTMDHIIPLSRGGKNEPENLVSLCEPCNTQKGNMLYLPSGYYMAIENSGELATMEKYVEKWFQRVKAQFDIQKFPFIAPITNVTLLPYHTRKVKRDIKYNPQLIYRWSIVGRDSYDEIESVTELNIREIRSIFDEYRKEAEDKKEAPVALYSFRKLTNDKIIAVIAVRVEPEIKHVSIVFPWCISTKYYAPGILASFINNLFRTIDRIVNLKILDYYILSKVPNALSCLRYGQNVDAKMVEVRAGSYTHKVTGEWGADEATVLRTGFKEMEPSFYVNPSNVEDQEAPDTQKSK